MATVRKTITLDERQNAWIKTQLARRGFTNDSEYIRDLLRRDEEAQTKLAGLQAAIAAGIESGVTDMSLDAIWADAEERSGQQRG